jgi:hypothetical protein
MRSNRSYRQFFGVFAGARRHRSAMPDALSSPLPCSADINDEQEFRFVISPFEKEKKGSFNMSGIHRMVRAARTFAPGYSKRSMTTLHCGTLI